MALVPLSGVVLQVEFGASSSDLYMATSLEWFLNAAAVVAVSADPPAPCQATQKNRNKKVVDDHSPEQAAHGETSCLFRWFFLKDRTEDI